MRGLDMARYIIHNVPGHVQWRNFCMRAFTWQLERYPSYTAAVMVGISFAAVSGSGCWIPTGAGAVMTAVCGAPAGTAAAAAAS
jgi:hypothetical protein